MKKIFLFFMVIITMSLSAGCSGKRETLGVSEKPIQPSLTPVEATEEPTVNTEVEETYPRDENGCVDNEFAEYILMKKSNGAELSKVREELINFFFLEGDYGMAVVDFHSIGMQQSVIKIFSTTDGGRTWQLIKDDYFISVGHMDCVFVKDKLVFTVYSSGAEETVFFSVGIDGEVYNMPDEFYEKHNFENVNMQTKLEYLPNEKTIACSWFENYDFDNVKYKTFYDEDMNLK